MKQFLIASCLILGLTVTGGLYLAWQKVAPQLVAEDTAAKAAEAAAQQAAAAAAQKAAEEAAAKEAYKQKESGQIQTLIETFAKQQAAPVYISVLDLDTDASGAYQADSQVVSASLYKIYVAYGIYKEVDNGQLTTSTKMKATGKTVDACLTAMITVSDNDCGKALGDLVGWSSIDTQIHNLGFVNTRTNNYNKGGAVINDKMTTANDVTHFLQKLYEGSLLSKSSTDAFISLLKNDELNDWLPAGLPDGTVIAHKTGALYGYIHDDGIVYGTKGNYIVTMMSGEWNSPTKQAPPVFVDLSQKLWNFFNS